MSPYPLSDMFVRFVVITAVAAVWCSLSIPVEGVDNNVEEDHEGEQNCLKAIQEVQKDPNNEETVRRFINLCKEFIDEMDLSENQTAILEQAGYKRSKKSKGKVEENKIGDKDVTDRKDKTEEPDEKVTLHKKNHTKDPGITDKQDKYSDNNQEASAGKMSEAGVYDSTTHDKDDVKREKEGVKHPKLNQNKEKSPTNIHKEAPKPQGKDEAEETLPQGEKISESETVISAESEHQKSQEKQIPQGEQVKSQNLQGDIPLFDFSTLNFPEMTPEELAKTIGDLKEVRRMIKMQHAPQPEVQMHANFPDPTLQGINAPHFGQGIPQFQHQEWNAQFQNPAFTEGIPHMSFEQGNGIPKPTFQQGIPPFPQQNVPPFPQQNIPPFPQQNIPPFPQQAEFAGHFQHQHFGQGIPQVPPAPEWAAPFPDQKFGQDIPQPNSGIELSEASQVPDQQQTIHPPNVPPTNEELSTKRQIDEL